MCIPLKHHWHLVTIVFTQTNSHEWKFSLFLSNRKLLVLLTHPTRIRGNEMEQEKLGLYLLQRARLKAISQTDKTHVLSRGRVVTLDFVSSDRYRYLAFWDLRNIFIIVLIRYIICRFNIILCLLVLPLHMPWVNENGEGKVKRDLPTSNKNVEKIISYKFVDYSHPLLLWTSLIWRLF